MRNLWKSGLKQLFFTNYHRCYVATNKNLKVNRKSWVYESGGVFFKEISDVYNENSLKHFIFYTNEWHGRDDPIPFIWHFRVAATATQHGDVAALIRTIIYMLGSLWIECVCGWVMRLIVKCRIACVFLRTDRLDDMEWKLGYGYHKYKKD